MAVTYTIQGRLDGLNDYTRSCRTNAYKGADCKMTARKRIKESVNTAYRYGYAKRN